MTNKARSVLFPVDASENSQKAFDFYLDFLKYEGDELFLMHVFDTTQIKMGFGATLADAIDIWRWKNKEEEDKAQDLMTHYKKLCEKHNLRKKVIIDVNQKPGEAIIKEAKKNAVTIIIMGSRGLNQFRRTFTGSVTDYVLHHSHIPVIVVPPTET